MNMVKSILREELSYAEEARQHYLDAIAKLPRGNLSIKRINGKEYQYLQYREGNKVRSESLSKLSPAERDDLTGKIQERNRNKRLLREVEQKINYLKKVLNAKG